MRLSHVSVELAFCRKKSGIWASVHCAPLRREVMLISDMPVEQCLSTACFHAAVGTQQTCLRLQSKQPRLVLVRAVYLMTAKVFHGVEGLLTSLRLGAMSDEWRWLISGSALIGAGVQHRFRSILTSRSAPMPGSSPRESSLTATMKAECGPIPMAMKFCIFAPLLAWESDQLKASIARSPKTVELSVW